MSEKLIFFVSMLGAAALGGLWLSNKLTEYYGRKGRRDRMLIHVPLREEQVSIKGLGEAAAPNLIEELKLLAKQHDWDTNTLNAMLNEGKQKHLRRLNMNLSLEQSQAVYLYTLPAHVGNMRFFRLLNEALRSTDASAWNRTTINLILATLKLPKPTVTMLHRFTKLPDVEIKRIQRAAQNKTSLTQWGCCSTSVKSDLAYFKSKANVHFKLTPQNVPGIGSLKIMSAVPSEEEFLVGWGAMYSNIECEWSSTENMYVVTADVVASAAAPGSFGGFTTTSVIT